MLWRQSILWHGSYMSEHQWQWFADLLWAVGIERSTAHLLHCHVEKHQRCSEMCCKIGSLNSFHWTAAQILVIEWLSDECSTFDFSLNLFSLLFCSSVNLSNAFTFFLSLLTRVFLCFCQTPKLHFIKKNLIIQEGWSLIHKDNALWRCLLLW